MEEEKRTGLDRRTFLRRAALTGAAAAWATPIVQTVTARSAFASTGTPVGECHHSFGAVNCKDTCKSKVVNESTLDSAVPVKDPCEQICDAACPENCNTDERLCVNNNFCEAECWKGLHSTGEGACTSVCFTCPVTVSASFPGTCTVGTIPTFATNCEPGFEHDCE
jgi:hypothetical protein